MEFKILFYVVGLIIYLVVSARKAAKKRQDAQARSNPNPSPEKKSWEEELQEILKRNLEGQSQEKTIYVEEEDEEIVPEPRYEVPIDHVPEVSARSTYEKQKEFDWTEHLNQESYSIESDDTPLETHIEELEAAMKKKEEPASVGRSILEEDGFDARKAFIYSEIFRAKYLEEDI